MILSFGLVQYNLIVLFDNYFLFHQYLDLSNCGYGYRNNFHYLQFYYMID